MAKSGWRCPCGAYNPPTDHACEACGAERIAGASRSSPPTPPPEDARCAWLNPSGYRCLRAGDVGSPTRWYCGWHYYMREYPRSTHVFDEFERFLSRADGYCCTDAHYRASYLWALCQGETVPRESPHPCARPSCQLAIVADHVVPV